MPAKQDTCLSWLLLTPFCPSLGHRCCRLDPKLFWRLCTGGGDATLTYVNLNPPSSLRAGFEISAQYHTGDCLLPAVLVLRYQQKSFASFLLCRSPQSRPGLPSDRSNPRPLWNQRHQGPERARHARRARHQLLAVRARPRAQPRQAQGVEQVRVRAGHGAGSFVVAALLCASWCCYVPTESVLTWCKTHSHSRV